MPTANGQTMLIALQAITSVRQSMIVLEATGIVLQQLQTFGKTIRFVLHAFLQHLARQNELS